VVAAVRIDAGACAHFLQRFAEAITVAVGDADLVLVAQFVFVDAGHMATFDEVRHAADHIPGAHEALQVDRRIRVGRAGVLARGDGGSLAAMAGAARDRASSTAQNGRIEVMRERARMGFARAWSTVRARSVNGVATCEKGLAQAVLHCLPEKAHERTFRPSPCN
jgi:hypothetical protein